MGFMDGFKKGLAEGQAASHERQSQSSYKTVIQQDAEREEEKTKKLKSQSDGALLQKINSIYTSEDEKKDIENVLRMRGYTKNQNGFWDRS